MKFKLRMLASFVIALIALYFLYTNINLGEILEIIGKTNLSIYILAFIFSYLGILARVYRWDLLLKNIDVQGKLRDVFEVYFLSMFANCLLPAKLGDVYRGHLAKKNFNVSMSKTIGTVFVERIVDIVSLVALLSISGFLLFGSQIPENIMTGLKIVYTIAGVLVVSIILMKKQRERIISLLPGKVGDYFERFETGCSMSLRKRRLGITWTTALVWLFDLTRLFLVTRALGLDVPLEVIIFILPAMALLTALPITPAGLGAVELTITGILVLVGFDINVAASVAILERIIDYWSYVFFGALLYMFSKKT